MPRKEIDFPCEGITLEGILEYPDSEQGPYVPGIVCHPHPLYGGNMSNNVVKVIKRTFLKNGMACLRFNFRGVGQSEGAHDDGIGEKNDVKAAMDYLESLDLMDKGGFVISGYSFGCWVALAASSDDPRAKALIGVSPPLDMYDFNFLKTETRPKLLMAGDRDFVCSVENFNQLANDTPEPKSTQLMKGVDHFHIGSEDLIASHVEHFLAIGRKTY